MNTDKNTDAFRLGCYSAAKHAGASHLEALHFVADLDARARAQDAFALGAYKVAAEHGATHEEALEFSKKAGLAALGQGAGQLIGKAAPAGLGALRWLGGKVTGGATNVAKGIHQGKGLGQGLQGPLEAHVPGKALQAMGRHPGRVGAATVGATGALGGASMLPSGGNEAQAAEVPGPGVSRAELYAILQGMTERQAAPAAYGRMNPYFQGGY